MESDSPELESTRADDSSWLLVTEESIVFDESFVVQKYGEIDEDKDAVSDSEDEELVSLERGFIAKEKNKELETAHKLIGLVEVEEAVFKKNAIEQWTRELLEICTAPRDSSSSFQSLLRKRLEVQHRLHKAILRDRERNRKTTSDTGPEEEVIALSSVPVVMRVGVLALFPLMECIRSLSAGSEGGHYAKLCRQVLDILLTVLSTLPRLALHREPDDCLDAFQEFVLGLIRQNDFRIDAEENAQAVVALVGLAVSRANVKDMLRMLVALFNVHQNATADGARLKIGSHLRVLSEFRKDLDLSAIFERCYTGSWDINETSVAAAALPADIPSRIDAVASDGSFLYVHSFNKGLRKVGSRYSGTLKGHVYASNPSYRKSDMYKSMACVGNKLLYLLPKVRSMSPSTSPTSPAAEASSASVPAASADMDEEDDDSDEDEEADAPSLSAPASAVSRPEAAPESLEDEKHVQIAVIDTSTLKEERVVTLTRAEDETVSPRSYLTSDGYQLYFITQRKAKKSSTAPDGADQYKYVVEVFLLNQASTELQLQRTFELGTVRDSKSKSKKGPEPSVQPVHWDRTSVYATGYQLCFLLPESATSTEFTKVRVFSVIDGQFLAEVSVDPQTCGLAVCFDSTNNVIWSHNENGIDEWKNLGPAPKDPQEPHPGIHPRFSPESMLAQTQPLAKLDAVQPLFAILTIVANLDRLSRQHPIYSSRVFPPPDQISTLGPGSGEDHDPSGYVYCVGPDPQVFRFLHTIIVKTLEGRFDVSTQAYIVLASLRLLKVNVYELDSNKSARRAGYDEPLRELRALLETFIDKPPFATADPYASRLIQREACNILSVGLVSFHASPAEQKARLVELLDSAGALSPGRKLLLDTLLLQLADWEDVATVLLADELGAEKMDVDQADKMEIDKEGRPEKDARRMLFALVEYVHEEGIAAVDACTSGEPKTSPLVSPALRLLLSLQRDLTSNVGSEHLLFDFACTVFYKAREFADHVHEIFPKLPASAMPALEHAMNSSLLRSVVMCLGTPLTRRRFVADPEFAGGLSAILTRLIKSIDALNKLFQSASEADVRYLRRSNAKKDKRVRVETKHPYAYGKQQLKQTVTIPGAEALCLHFDPRSRTMSSSGDVLQLFKSAAMNEPLINTKDGKQMIYSGTNFPRQAITVRGDSVTFLFSASSRPDPRNVDDGASRWGFRCRIMPLTPTESYEPLFCSWLLDLENLLCTLAGKYAAGLIEGEAISELEQKYSSWLNAKLLAGGLGDTDLTPAAKRFLEDFIENRGDAATLYAWMCKQQKPRRAFTVVARPHVEAAERFVMAAIFKHLGLVDDAQDFVQYLKADEMGSPSSMAADALNKEMFSLIVSEASKVSVSIQLRGQVDKMWRAAVKEKQTFEAFNAAMRDEKKEKLLEMCEIKGVEFDMDEKTTIQRLFDKLQADARAFEENPAASEANSYELMAQPIIERAKLLLRMRSAKKEVESPSAETPNPFAIHRSVQPGEENGNASPASMLRSSSYYPRTETSISKESKRARLEQKNAAFSRRVQELRKWLSAFKGWRKWQEGALDAPVAMTDDPLHAVTSFVQSYIDPKQLEELLKVHTLRAKSRIEGLKNFHQLVGLISFHSARHQLLGAIGHPISSVGLHYSADVNACGAELSEKVTDAYALVFRQLIKILSDKTVDTMSRLMSLVVCGVSYRDFDVELLRAVKIFGVLQQVISECNAKVTAANRKAAFLSSHPVRKAGRSPVVIDTEKKEEERQYKEEVHQRAQLEREDKEELDRIRTLRNSCWTAFRLLTTRVVGWEREPGDGVADSEALRELHDQVFDLMCAELKSMSQRVRLRADDEDDQCYELLSLLCLLGGSPTGHKALGRSENLLNLVSIIKADSSEPRAKRLALRLLRRLLPTQNTDSIPKLIEFFLEQIGSAIFFEKQPQRPSSRPGTPDAVMRDVAAAPGSPGPKAADASLPFGSTVSAEKPPLPPLPIVAMEEDEDDDHSDDEEEEETPAEEQFAVYLQSWVHGHARLVDLCNAAMPNFFVPPGAMSIDRHSLESRGQQLLQAMAEEGSVLLKTSSLPNVNLIATTIAAHGGSVTVAPVPPKSATSGDASEKNASGRNAAKVLRKSNPVPWLSGEVAHSLSSEYLCLLRLLMDPQKGGQWSSDIDKALRIALTSIPAVLSGAAPADLARRALASLCVLGGYTETVRVGSSVLESTDGGGAPRRGTVIELLSGDESADVVFDADALKAPRTVRLSKLRAVPDVDVDPGLFALSDEVLASLLYFLSPEAKISAAGWLQAELKWRSLEALAKLLQNPASAERFLVGPAPEVLPALVQVALSGNPSARLSILEAEEVRLSKQIWDAFTKPQSADDPSTVKMSSILPHLPYADQAELLPTGFSPDKLQGFVFRSQADVRRKLEYVYDPAQQLSRRAYGISRGVPMVVAEVAVLANAGVQAAALPEYYFEVTIDRMESNGSLISVGLIPEGGRTWINGSYKYQANAKKATFTNGQKRQHDYGVAYRAKSTIGCLWNRDEKAIYFTKDGADLGAAFTGVALGKFYPAVGVSKGVQVSINFGQEPFKFARKSVAESQEEKEKRRLELEAKRKLERQAEKERREKEVAPLVNMGFTLKMALIAMRQTHNSGIEAASNWLVENMGSYPFDDEESDKDEEAKEEPKPKAKEEEKRPAEEKKAAVVVTEESYSTGACQNYVLSDNISYAEPDAGKKQKGVPEVPSEWEENIIPTIRSFMEKDGFSNFEVEEYVQQIRGALGSLDEPKAQAIVTQILGGAGLPIQFPSTRQAASSDSKGSSLKVEELSRGMWISVSKVVPGDAKGWVPQMERTIGRTGLVKSVDHQNSLVLVQFYDPEVALLSEWWYPVRLLERPEHASGRIVEDLVNLDAAKQRAESAATQLQQIWARKLVLSLLQHCPLGLDATQSPVTLKSVLSFIALEGVQSQLFRIPALPVLSSGPVMPTDESSTFFADRVRDRLLGLLNAGNQSEALIGVLVNETVALLKQQCVFVTESATLVASAKPPEPGPVAVKIDGARSVAVVFERSCSVQSSSQAFLQFYADEQCAQLLHTFTSDKSKFPVVLPTSQFWVKLVCQSAASRSNCKYRFWAVPVHPEFGLACWLIDFLLCHAFKHIPDVQAVCSALFEASLNLVYALSVPTVLKETAVYLVGQVIQASRRLRSSRQLPLNRLAKLKAEMHSLQETERKREGALYSSYLQSLVELTVTANEPIQPPSDAMEVDTSNKDATPAAPVQTPAKPANPAGLPAASPATPAPSGTSFAAPPGAPAAKKKRVAEPGSASSSAEASVAAAAPSSAPAHPPQSQPPVSEDDEALSIAMVLAKTLKESADKVFDSDASAPAASVPSAPAPPASAVPPATASAPESAAPAPAATPASEAAPARSEEEMTFAAIHQALFESEDMDEDMRAALALSLAASPLKSDASGASAASAAAAAASSDDVQMATADEDAEGFDVAAIAPGEDEDDDVSDDDEDDDEGDEHEEQGPLGEGAADADEDADDLEDMDDEMKAALALSMQEVSAAVVAVDRALSVPTEEPKAPAAPPAPALAAAPASAEPSAKPAEEKKEEKKAGALPSLPLPPPGVLAPGGPVAFSLPFSAMFGPPPPREPGSLAPPPSMFSFGSRGSRSSSPSRRGNGRSSPALPRPSLTSSGNGSQNQGSSDAPTKPKAQESSTAWLDKVIAVKQLLKALLTPDEHPEALEKFVRIAWPVTRKETMKERLVLLDNLPMVDLNAKDELEALIKRTLRDIAPITDLYMPLDEPTKQTKGYAFVQLISQQKVEAVVRKLHKHHLKLPNLADDGANSNLKSSLRASASLPRGTIKVSKFAELEAKDARVADYFQSKIVVKAAGQPPSLTPLVTTVLTEVFNQFGGDKHGALVAKQLNELQMASNGEVLTQELIDYAFKTYKTKPVGAEIGLTLEGFLDLYLTQSVDIPMDTWDELFRLGYDLSLNQNAFVRYEEALRSQAQAWSMASMSQLIDLAETQYAFCELSSPLQLPLDQLTRPAAETPAALAYPLLARQSTPSIRLRFELLRMLNEQLRDALPFVNLSRTHADSVAQLLISARSLVFHTTKTDFFYEVLDKTSVQQVPQPVVNIDRLKLAAKTDKLLQQQQQQQGAPTEAAEAHESFILNHTLFGIAFQQLRHTSATGMRQKKPPGTEPHFGIKIVFKGENVQGEGGPYRQFFTDISRELQGKLPLFIMCPNAQHGTGENRDKWIINPSADSPLHIAMFEFLGRLMGLAIRTGVLLILDLPPFFWKPLVGLPNEPRDLQAIDKSIYAALDYFSKCTREQFEQECPHDSFTAKLSDGSSVPLVSGGEHVKITYDNRLEYIRLVEQIRLNESATQIAAIRRGLGEIVPLPVLSLCTWQDLDWKVCGKPYVDINLLKRHTLCSGVASDAPHVLYFWNVMHELNQADRRGFLRFAWAQERLPPNDEEFERTKTRMMIKPFPNLADPNSAFPKADTCFFNLMLPEYTSQKILRDRLLFAVATDSHSMNADEPQEDDLVGPPGRRVPPGAYLHEYTDESDSE